MGLQKIRDLIRLRKATAGLEEQAADADPADEVVRELAEEIDREVRTQPYGMATLLLSPGTKITIDGGLADAEGGKKQGRYRVILRPDRKIDPQTGVITNGSECFYRSLWIARRARNMFDAAGIPAEIRIRQVSTPLWTRDAFVRVTLPSGKAWNLSATPGMATVGEPFAEEGFWEIPEEEWSAAGPQSADIFHPSREGVGAEQITVVPMAWIPVDDRHAIRIMAGINPGDGQPGTEGIDDLIDVFGLGVPVSFVYNVSLIQLNPAREIYTRRATVEFPKQGLWKILGSLQPEWRNRILAFIQWHYPPVPSNLAEPFALVWEGQEGEGIVKPDVLPEGGLYDRLHEEYEVNQHILYDLLYATVEWPALWNPGGQPAGLEEFSLGNPQPLAGRPVGEVIPIQFKGEGRRASGRALVVDPARALLRQVVNPEVASGRWDWQGIRGKPNEQQPGQALAAIVADPARLEPGYAPPAGAVLVAATHTLQTNFWEPQGFLIRGGQLVAIPGVTWREEPWVFALDSQAPGLRRLRLEKGVPQPDGIGEAVVGPVLVRDGRDVTTEIRPYSPGNPDPNLVRWDPATTRAAFSALGRTADNRLILGSLRGTLEDLQGGSQECTAGDMARAMLALGATEAILLGGSIDVQQWVEGDGAEPAIQARHRSPPHGSGRPLNAALLIYAAGGLEETQYERRLTDPRNHNEEAFTYWAHMTSGLDAQLMATAFFQPPMLTKPHEIPGFSVSLLHRDGGTEMLSTYRNQQVGYILRVPEDNIAWVAPFDFVSDTTLAYIRAVLGERARRGLLPFDQLLEAYRQYQTATEALVLGTGPSGQKVETAGIVVIQNPDGTDPDEAGYLVQRGQKQGLPIVRIRPAESPAVARLVPQEDFLPLLNLPPNPTPEDLIAGQARLDQLVAAQERAHWDKRFSYLPHVGPPFAGGLEEGQVVVERVTPEAFQQRFPRARWMDGARGVYLAAPETVSRVRFYAGHDTLWDPLQQWLNGEQAKLPEGMEAHILRLPADAAELEAPGVIVKDWMLQLPYGQQILPELETAVGEPLPSLSTMILFALKGAGGQVEAVIGVMTLQDAEGNTLFAYFV